MTEGKSPADKLIFPLLSETVLFDTMIIRHLCAVEAGELLVQVFKGRIAWPVAVDAELTLQSQYVPHLGTFLSSCSADILEIAGEDEAEVEDVRLDMYTKRETREDPTRHLGEAQCLFLAEHDGFVLATNDEQARRRAWKSHSPSGKPQAPGAYQVRVFHVVEVLLSLVRADACSPDEAWDFYERAYAGSVYALKGYPIPASRVRFLQVANELAAV